MLRSIVALFTIALAIGLTVCGLMGIVPIYISAIVVFILKVAVWLLPIFDDVEEDGAGFLSVKGSLGVYVEDADEYDTILFARKDYYSDADM